jgi:hypothetical protein
MPELALWREFDAQLSALCGINRAHSRTAMYAAGFSCIMATEGNQIEDARQGYES